MATVFQDIHVVRSLRKELRDPTLPLSIVNAISTIHECINNGSDLNGWKKVNWRSSGGNNHQSNSGAGRSYAGDRSNDRNNSFRSGSYGNNTNSKGNGFFRSSSGVSGHTSSDTTSAFSSKGRYNNTQNYRGAGSFDNRSSEVKTSETSVIENKTNHVSSFPLTSSSHSNSHNSSPYVKYVSKFRKETDTVDDTIINNIILGKLNKMSNANYDEIKEFITHIIDSDQTEMTKCFMRLVFQKATVEEIFCPLYAKLLGELSVRYPVLLTEMANLYSSYMQIFEEVDETKEENYKEFVKRNVEKKYRRGYSQFIAELIKHGVINTELFIKTINTIVKQIETNKTNPDSIKLNEDYTDCLSKIINAIKSDDVDDEDENIEEIKKIIHNDVSKQIKPYTVKNPDNKGISTKARFIFLNIYEDIEKF